MNLKHTGSEGLSGSTLKYIALISMLIDHIGAVVFEYGLYYQGLSPVLASFAEEPFENGIYSFTLGLRMVGRIAFPIYCFLLTEGFRHTRNRKRYFLRLLIFALISEVPFDLAAFNQFWDMGHQNVFFTLATGLLVMEGISRIEARFPSSLEMQYLFSCLIAGTGCGAAYLLRCDYDVIGVLLIVILYYARGDRRRSALGAGIMGFLETWPHTLGFGALSALPIWLYNGKRGSKKGKYLLYWFYPLHLLALTVVRIAWLGISVN